jgi:hypothetical protein
MLPRLSSLVLICLIYTSAINAASSRLARADTNLPIANAAEAPLGDNIATASGSDAGTVQVPAPADMLFNNTVTSAVSEAATETANTTVELPGSNKPSSMDECDQNNVGFELITGYVLQSTM